MNLNPGPDSVDRSGEPADPGGQARQTQEPGRPKHATGFGQHRSNVVFRQQIEDVVRYEAIAGRRRLANRRPAIGQPHFGARCVPGESLSRELNHPRAEIYCTVNGGRRQIILQQPERESAGTAAEFEHGLGRFEVRVAQQKIRRPVLVERL